MLREMFAVGVTSKQTMIYQDTPRFVSPLLSWFDNYY
jgi:hypothetical protein